MTSEPADTRGGDGLALFVLLLSVFVSLIGFGIVIPLLPFYAIAFGAPAWQITLLFSAFSLGQFVGEPFWGRLSDRIGRKPVLVITMVASAAGYTALAFAPGIWSAVAIRLVSGFLSGNISTIQGYVADITPPEKRVHRLGLIGAAFGLGFTVGPAIGGVLARPDLGAAGFRPPLLAAAGLCMVAALGVWLLVRESRSAQHMALPKTRFRAAFADAGAHPVLRRVLLMTIVAFAGFSAMQSVFGLWTQARFGWGPWGTGVALGVTGLFAALAQGLLAGPANRRLGEITTVIIGLSAAGVTLLIQGASPLGWLAAASLPITAIGFSICQPSTAALISRATTPEHQGAMLGVNAAAGALARIVGPLAAGPLFYFFGHNAPFLAAALGMIPAIWLTMKAGDAVKAMRARA